MEKLISLVPGDLRRAISDSVPEDLDYTCGTLLDFFLPLPQFQLVVVWRVFVYVPFFFLWGLEGGEPGQRSSPFPLSSLGKWIAFDGSLFPCSCPIA